jgi:hypothetical protein
MSAAAFQADAMARVTWLKDQWLHHFGETLQIQRAAAAQSYGLIPEQYVSPLPGSVSNIFYGEVPAPVQATAPATPPQPAAPPQPNVTATAPTQNAVGPLPASPGAAVAATPIIAAGEGLFLKALPWVLSAALGTGGLGAAAGYFLSPKTTPTAAVTAVQPAAPASVSPVPAPVQKPQEWEIKYKVGPDGKWQTQVTPIAPES